MLFKIRSQACATRNGAAAPAQPPSAGNQLPVTPASLLYAASQAATFTRDTERLQANVEKIRSEIR